MGLLPHLTLTHPRRHLRPTKRVQRLLLSTPPHLMIRMKKKVLVAATLTRKRKIREIRKKTKKLKKKAKNRKKRAKSKKRRTKRPKKTKRRRKRLSDKKLEDIKLLDMLEDIKLLDMLKLHCKPSAVHAFSLFSTFLLYNF